MPVFVRAKVSFAFLLSLGWASGNAVAMVPSGPETPAAPHALADLTCTHMTVNGNDVTIDTNAQPKLSLSWTHPDMVRVFVSIDGTLQRGESFATVREAWPSVAFAASDEGSYLRFKSPRLAVRVYKKPCRVAFYQADDQTLISDEEPSGGAAWPQGQRVVTKLIGSHEHFYGLGEDNDAFLGRLDRRGTRRELWTGQKIAPGHATADFPVPFFLSTGEHGGGYGMFFDNTYRSVFDLGAATSDTLAWSALGGDLLYYFIYGPGFPSILDRYTTLTGKPPLPPLWVLGFIQSKCSYWDWDEIDEVASQMRKRQLPFDAMVFDFDWAEQLQNFHWHSRWKNQSPAKLKEYARSGIKFLQSDSGPMIRKDSSNYASGMQAGIFASDGHGKPLTCGYYGGDLMDFSAPAMKSWLWPQIAPLHEQGIRGWWLDLTEPEGEPPTAVYAGGGSAKIHNVVSSLMAKTYYEMLTEHDPGMRPFMLARTGFAGIQKYGAAVWSGDINSDYETFAAHIPEALNTGLSGFHLWTNDSGGFLTGLYKNNLWDHGLLYERWLQFSTFAPIARAHHVGPSAPYMFGAEIEAGNRHYLSLRYQLLPYIYSYYWEAHHTGTPLLRPLVYAFQDDPQVADLKTEYLFGPDLLVAPVVTEKATEREVYVPAGTWFDYDYGYVYKGGRSYMVDAPQHRLPLLVRAGAIIPMYPPMQNTQERRSDELILDLYPAGDSAMTLYNDDGETTLYQSAQRYTETAIEMHEDGGHVQVSINEGNKLFTPSSYRLLVHLQHVPERLADAGGDLTSYRSRAEFDAASTGYYWDHTAGVAHVKLRTGSPLRYQLQISASPQERQKRSAPGLLPQPRSRRL